MYKKENFVINTTNKIKMKKMVALETTSFLIKGKRSIVSINVNIADAIKNKPTKYLKKAGNK